MSLKLGGFAVPIRNAICSLALQLLEVRYRQVCEARHNIPPYQLFWFRDVSLFRHLYLKLTLSELKIEQLIYATVVCGRVENLMFGDLIAPCYA